MDVKSTIIYLLPLDLSNGSRKAGELCAAGKMWDEALLFVSAQQEESLHKANSMGLKPKEVFELNLSVSLSRRQ